MEPILELKDVCKSFSKSDFRLDNVSFSLPYGAIMGFVGENGAGKTTTIGCILNTIASDSGTVRLFGTEMTDADTQMREKIGIVYDGDNFPGYLTAEKLAKIMEGFYESWDNALFRKYLNDFHLPPRQKIKSYSKGMTMKLAISAALAHRPKLLILDEATSGLDPIMRDEMLDVFLEFVQEEDHSILLSSHITSDLEKIADYITFLHEGKIFFCEPKDRLLDDYGVLKCTAEEFNAMDKGIVLGHRANRFGVEALIRRKDAKAGQMMDPAGIEDVMLFLVKGESE